MRKVFSALFLSVFIFAILNFLYWNLNDEVFNYPMSFRFNIPHVYSIQSVPVPLGFVVITAFCLGIVFLALLQAIPALFKTIALRSRDRKIRELEKELEESRHSKIETVSSTENPQGE